MWTFQAYLLEGLVQWNNASLSNATSLKSHWNTAQDPRYFNPKVHNHLQKLRKELFCEDEIMDDADALRPDRYTGELFGVQYLNGQTGRSPDKISQILDDEEETILES